jgi:hypothetical protein
MDFLGIFSSALLLFLLLLIVLNIYCIHAYYKLTDKINQIYFVIDSIRKEQHEQHEHMTGGENKKEINILPENFKHFYYPTSSSSLIEVSSDDNTSSYETDSDDEHDIDFDFNDCKIKNVHMSLELDNLEDIHVLLLDEISNIEGLNSVEEEKESTSAIIVEKEEEPNSAMVVEKEEEPNSVTLEEKETEKEELNTIMVIENNINELSEPKELNFKPKKRESRKNMGDGDYKKMNLTDLRKYVIENNLNIDTSKMKKPEILRAMEELKKNECKEIVKNEYDNNFRENDFKNDEIINSPSLVDVVEEIL